MKRYIEIVIDNSGSMTNTMANGKSRLENAKTLIKDEITKALDFTQDCVVVRTLRRLMAKANYTKWLIISMPQALRHFTIP
jgi:ABC-type dipeptide/oligopeptide/nickel transport system ATPase component